MNQEPKDNTTQNIEMLSRGEAIKKIGGYAALTALGTFMILNPQKAQAQSIADPGSGGGFPCDDGNPCTENDVEIIDACFNSDICIPCAGTPVFPDVCNDFDCTNGIEFWNDQLCECDVELLILGCTDVNSCNYDSEANCDSECDYSCLDCRGVPYGTWTEDNCGICLSPEDEIRDLTCLAGPFIPNSFTPNNDGVNDYFSVSTARPFAHFELTVLDKWGQIVFQSSDSEFRWLGNKNNGDHYLPSDIYTYKLIYNFKDST